MYQPFFWTLALSGNRTKSCPHGSFLFVREDRQILLLVVIGAMEENQAENREYGATCNQKGLSHKVTCEKGPKKVREQAMWISGNSYPEGAIVQRPGRSMASGLEEQLRGQRGWSERVRGSYGRGG